MDSIFTEVVNTAFSLSLNLHRIHRLGRSRPKDYSSTCPRSMEGFWGSREPALPTPQTLGGREVEAGPRGPGRFGGLGPDPRPPPCLTSLGSPDPVSIFRSSSSPMSGYGSGFNQSSNGSTDSTSEPRRTCKGHSADIRRPGRKCGRLLAVPNISSDWHVLPSIGRG